MKRVPITASEVYPDYSGYDTDSPDCLFPDDYGALLTEEEFKWMKEVNRNYCKLQEFLRQREVLSASLYDLIDSSIEDATRICKRKKLDVRIIEMQDGKFDLPEEDFNPKRVNLFVKDGNVEEAFVG